MKKEKLAKYKEMLELAKERLDKLRQMRIKIKGIKIFVNNCCKSKKVVVK